jgi:hypothetical protein
MPKPIIGVFMSRFSAVVRTITLLWIGWFVVVLGIQIVTPQRIDLKRPDRAVAWSATETTTAVKRNNPLLADPFMNETVAWDSEYYLSIALNGYDDRSEGMDWVTSEDGDERSLNYAFFPLYPQVMKGVMALLAPFTATMTGLARGTLAGVAVSLLGTLAAMFALYDLARDGTDDADRLRAVAYLLVFPSAFFMAMVYTEGLFMGIAFGALALSKRGHWLWASLLALFAPWARAVGVALAIPLAVRWLAGIDREQPLRPQITGRFVAQGLLAALPVASYLAWRLSDLGRGWAITQQWFGRAELSISQTLDSYRWHLEHAATHPESQVYFALEFFLLALALVTTLVYLRQDPAIALFGLAVILLSTFSGSAQGLARYMLPVAPIYLVLARLGRNPAFDRTWMLAGGFTMGLSAVLFAFDFWVG